MQIIEATFAISKDNKTNPDKRDFPVPQPHIRILYWLCGEGGSLAQVTVHRQILKENEIEVYEKNNKSSLSS